MSNSLRPLNQENCFIFTFQIRTHMRTVKFKDSKSAKEIIIIHKKKEDLKTKK